MKKIISLILILTGIIIIHSCRQQEEQQGKDTKIQVSKSTATEMHKDTDTITANREYLADPRDWDEDPTVTDPPPKDGDQWRDQK